MRVYPQWFIDNLYNEEDKQRAREGKLKTTEKVEFKCSKHGVYVLPVKKRIVVSRGEEYRGCPLCGKERQTSSGLKAAYIKNQELLKDKEFTRNRARNLWKGRLDSRAQKIVFPQWFIDELANEEDKELAKKGLLGSHQKCKFKCDKHGIYEQWVYVHMCVSTGERKSGCPMCVKPYVHSKYEDVVNEYIQSLGQTRVEKNIRGLIKPNDRNAEIDLYYPEYKIGIEFNGSYWHSTEGKSMKEPKDKDYHLNKFIASEKLGIHLIQIFDIDWDENENRIKMYLRSLFKSKIKIYGRKCEVRVIETKVAREFCDKYHLQGFSNHGTLNYGLFYEEGLYAVMSFGLQRYNRRGNGYYELHRYCVKDGFTVIGGAQKLHKYFVDNVPDLHEILSYSDNDYFLGSIYPKLGYSFEGYTSPRYYWYRDKFYLKREQTMLKNLKEKFPDRYEKVKELPGNKEDMIMIEEGYYKVYRSGNKKWVYKID